MLEDQIELGCSPGIDYPLCVGAESTARGMGSFIGWLAQTVLGSQELAPGTTLWDNAIGEASNWFAIAIVVMMITGVVGLATGMLSLKPKRLWASVGGIAASIPSTYLALALGGELLSISDQLSALTLERIGGEDGFSNLFRTVIQGGTGSDVGGMAMALTGVSAAAPMILMLLGIVIGLVMMSFALAFRNLGLMVLIAFAPLAFMAVPMQGGWGIAKKWALAGIALLLSKPLMFGILAMLLKTADGMAMFSPQTLTVMTGLFVVSFMPMMAYSFFAFLGSGNENMAGQGTAGPAGQKAAAPVRQVAGSAASRAGAGVGSVFSTSKATTATQTKNTTKKADAAKPAANQPSGGAGTGSKSGGEKPARSPGKSSSTGGKTSAPAGGGRAPGSTGPKGATGAPGARGAGPQVPAAPAPSSAPKSTPSVRPKW